MPSTTLDQPVELTFSAETLERFADGWQRSASPDMPMMSGYYSCDCYSSQCYSSQCYSHQCYTGNDCYSTLCPK